MTQHPCHFPHEPAQHDIQAPAKAIQRALQAPRTGSSTSQGNGQAIPLGNFTGMMRAKVGFVGRQRGGGVTCCRGAWAAVRLDQQEQRSRRDSSESCRPWSGNH